MNSSLNWHRPRRIEPLPKPLSFRIAEGVLVTLIILGISYIMLFI